MPTLATILIIYYSAGAIWAVARGPYVAVYTPLRAAVGVVLTVAVAVAWLSIPFCGGLPVLLWIALGMLWFTTFMSLFGIGQEVPVGNGTIAIVVAFAIVYVAYLSTATYC